MSMTTADTLHTNRRCVLLLAQLATLKKRQARMLHGSEPFVDVTYKMLEIKNQLTCELIALNPNLEDVSWDVSAR